LTYTVKFRAREEREDFGLEKTAQTEKTEKTEKKLKFQANGGGAKKIPREKSIQSAPEFVLPATAARMLRNAGRE
jgi:hypothetical protein